MYTSKYHVSFFAFEVVVSNFLFCLESFMLFFISFPNVCLSSVRH